MLKQASEQLQNIVQSNQPNSMEELSVWEQLNAWEELNTWEELNEQRCNQVIKGFHSMEAVEGFGLRLTQKDLYTLADSNWLNDEVINFYMNLLIARSTSSNKYPKVHAMNTYFYSKLLSGGHSSLKRWTRKVDIFAHDLIIIPIHLNVHWCMSIVDFRDKTIIYYDSMGSDNPKCLAALKLYLQNESLDKKKQPYDMSDWKFYSAKNIPRQTNGSDCGVFSCMFAEMAGIIYDLQLSSPLTSYVSGHPPP
ncbi:sentrin-specific protease-like [Temnothorax nylanderi]|uniref:sentrin-specific protease-like n=1 Tax=Temnothorax nylanderi TaxID=102681 RepID=UPI003A8AF6C8